MLIGVANFGTKGHAEPAAPHFATKEEAAASYHRAANAQQSHIGLAILTSLALSVISFGHVFGECLFGDSGRPPMDFNLLFPVEAALGAAVFGLYRAQERMGRAAQAAYGSAVAMGHVFPPVHLCNNCGCAA